jgi:hypothetical protein
MVDISVIFCIPNLNSECNNVRKPWLQNNVLCTLGTDSMCKGEMEYIYIYIYNCKRKKEKCSQHPSLNIIKEVHCCIYNLLGW